MGGTPEQRDGPKRNQELASTNADTGVSREKEGVTPEVRQVTMANLDWSAAVTVKPIGFRFLVPVPNLGAENEIIAVKTWDGKDKTVSGLAFRNSTDSAQQAVVGDGTGVIIIAVDAEKANGAAFAKEMLQKIADLGGVEKLNKAALTDLIASVPALLAKHAYNPAALPKSDVYDSTDSIAASLTPQSGLVATGSRPLGYYEKADKAGPVAVYVGGASAVLDGPHAGKANYEHGFLAVKIAPKKEGQAPSYRSVAPEAVSYCYALPDGSTIKTTELPQV